MRLVRATEPVASIVRFETSNAPVSLTEATPRICRLSRPVIWTLVSIDTVSPPPLPSMIRVVLFETRALSKVGLLISQV